MAQMNDPRWIEALFVVRHPNKNACRSATFYNMCMKFAWLGMCGALTMSLLYTADLYFLTFFRLTLNEVSYIAQVYAHTMLQQPGNAVNVFDEGHSLRRTPRNYCVGAFEAAFIFFLKQSHGGITFTAMETLFGCSEARIRDIFWFFCDWFIIQSPFKRLYNHNVMFPRSRAYLTYLKQAIAAANCPLNDCVGFIDGFWQATSKPYINPDSYYNGYFKGHGLMHFIVVGPDGLIWYASLGWPGRNTDVTTAQRSGIVQWLRSLRFLSGVPMFDQNLQMSWFTLLGDAIYKRLYPIIGMYSHPLGRHFLSPIQRQWNRLASGVRICVEWMVGKTKQPCKVVKFEGMTMLGKTQSVKLVYAAIILTNLKVVMRGTSQNARKFRVVVRPFHSFFPDLVAAGHVWPP